MDPQNVLNSWLFIEMIQPAELPKSNIIPGYLFSDGKQRQQINKMNFLQEFIKTAKPKNPRTYTTQYTYYMNCYKLSDLIDTFRSFFKHDDEVINKPKQRCYSFSFQVNDTNEYIEDSLFIPHVHTVIYDMLHTDKINYSHFIDRYNDARYQLEEDAKTLFSNGVTSETVQKLSKNFYRYFDEPTHDHLHFFEMHIVRKNADKNKPSFNSFYIEDLQTIKRKGMNETLHQFIKGKDLQVDIEQDHQAIESLLSPKNLPDGRWPSRIDHRLSLMQQVAVNQIIHGDGPVYSVNGPPGTGKTPSH